MTRKVIVGEIILEDLVSVIVPVYNVENYLEKCLTSILKQTYPAIELILVNDGSTDKSEIICRKFASKNAGIKIYNQINSGVSAARNLGINYATGKYIMFVDSDDWLPSDAIQKMIYSVKNASADLCVGDFQIVSSVRSYPKQYNQMDIIEHDESEKFASIISELDGKCWGKIFLSDIIKVHAIEFDKSIHWAEDAIFLADYLFYCKRLVFCNEITYWYNTLNSNSITKGYYSEYYKWVFVCFQRYVDLLETLPDSLKLREIRMKVLNYYITTTFEYYTTKTNQNDAIKMIKETFAMYQTFVDFEVSEKMGFNLILLSNSKKYEEVYSFVKNNCSDNEKKILRIGRKIIARIRYIYFYKFGSK